MTPLDANTLADALDCFWNAAIGESHSRQEGAATAAIMASGMAAVATHLRETAKLAGEQPPTDLVGENRELREQLAELAKHDGTQAELSALQQEHEKVLAALKEASVNLYPEPIHGVPGAWRYVAERRPTDWPRGTEIQVEHDGFKGRVLGPYVTFEGKKGQVCQQDGSRVVHVYGEKWLKRVKQEERGTC